MNKDIKLLQEQGDGSFQEVNLTPTAGAGLGFDGAGNPVGNVAVLTTANEAARLDIATALVDAATITLETTRGEYFVVTLQGNRSLAFTGAHKVGRTFQLAILQDGTGSRTVTWPTAVSWAGGAAPALSTTPNSGDIVSFRDDGTKWIGVLVAHGFATAPPAVPTGLATTPVSTSRIDLTFDAVAGAASYQVYRNSVLVGSPSTNSYSDTGLTANTTYTYTVAAVNGYGASAPCTGVDGTTPQAIADKAIQFAYNNEAPFQSNPISWEGNTFALDFWVKISSNPNAVLQIGIAGCFTLNITNSCIPTVELQLQNGPLVAPLWSNNIYDGNWHYIRFVLGTSDYQAKLFVDGTQVASTPYCWPISIMGTPVYLAGIWNAGVAIDLLRLSSCDRGNTTPTTLAFDENTIALYQFNEGVGGTAADSSGNDYTLTLPDNGSVIWVDGVTV